MADNPFDLSGQQMMPSIPTSSAGQAAMNAASQNTTPAASTPSSAQYLANSGMGNLMSSDRSMGASIGNTIQGIAKIGAAPIAALGQNGKQFMSDLFNPNGAPSQPGPPKNGVTQPTLPASPTSSGTMGSTLPSGSLPSGDQPVDLSKAGSYMSTSPSPGSPQAPGLPDGMSANPAWAAAAARNAAANGTANGPNSAMISGPAPAPGAYQGYGAGNDMAAYANNLSTLNAQAQPGLMANLAAAQKNLSLAQDFNTEMQHGSPGMKALAMRRLQEANMALAAAQGANGPAAQGMMDQTKQNLAWQQQQALSPEAAQMNLERDAANGNPVAQKIMQDRRAAALAAVPSEYSTTTPNAMGLPTTTTIKGPQASMAAAQAALGQTGQKLSMTSPDVAAHMGNLQSLLSRVKTNPNDQQAAAALSQEFQRGMQQYGGKIPEYANAVAALRSQYAAGK